MNLSLIINSFLIFEVEIFSLLFCDSNILSLCHTYETFQKGMKRDMPKTLEWRSWEIIDPFSLSIFKSSVALNMLNMHSILVYPPHRANSREDAQ